MKTIRILHYIGSLESGGSQAMIMEIYRNIDRNKIQFDFIVDRKKDFFYQNEIEKYGGKIYFFDEYFKGFNYFKYIKQWKFFFQNHNEYRVLHCHVRSVASIVLKMAKKYNYKTICHSHGASNGTGVKAFFKKILQKGIPKYSDYMLACSTDSARWLYGKRYFKSPKCVIIKNGINKDRFLFNVSYREEIRKKYSIEDDEIVIGHIGRFDPVKNHKFIIDLAKSITVNRNNKYRFMLCGDGPIKEEVINEIRKCDLINNFIIVDSTKEINKYYNAFDIFILPSKHEGLGIVLIEAQFNGLPCITSSGIPDDACISNGFIRKKLDIEEWISAVEQYRYFRNHLLLLDEKAYEYNIKESCKLLVSIYSRML